jgi:hypothetical protein
MRIASTFPEDSISFPVVTECNELRMPESILGRPFEELNRGDQVRLEPSVGALGPFHLSMGATEDPAPTQTSLQPTVRNRSRLVELSTIRFDFEIRTDRAECEIDEAEHQGETSVALKKTSI